MSHAKRTSFVLGLLLVGCNAVAVCAADAKPVFRAGAAEVDITPTTLPVIVSGGFQERTADKVQDPLSARALVLDDGSTRLAIVVVDTLMMSRELIDDVKSRAEQQTGIPTDHMLISATHTHSAPSVMPALGSRADETYLKTFPDSVVKSIELAAQRLQPARIGWSAIQDDEHNHCRRWIFRPDRMFADPFGQLNVRAHMHPGYQSPNHIGPSGPADTDLSMVALQTVDGKPLAVLANYAFHYFGWQPVSSDLCGCFGKTLAPLIGAEQSSTPFVGIMSQGTSGDSMWMDYSRPPSGVTFPQFAEAVAKSALRAWQKIEFRDWAPLKMAQSTLKLPRRVPDAARLAWAREVVAKMGDRLPGNQPEVYAWEQIHLHDRPEVELKLQVLRIGDLGIVALPCEVFGITGLKLKQQSPLPLTFNVELANGAEGYIPPPEQHALGGYTTWPARTASLEIQAEPKIVDALLQLLEQVAQQPRKTVDVKQARYAKTILAARPAAYFRLDDIAGSMACDSAGQAAAEFQPGVALFLPGVEGDGFRGDWRGNRAAHFAGGKLATRLDCAKDAVSVELWFWNGLPDDARSVTGYLYSRCASGAKTGDRLGIGGSQAAASRGRLFFACDDSFERSLVGKTVLQPKAWYHLVVVREGRTVRVHLNGAGDPEIAGELEPEPAASQADFVFAGLKDSPFSFEGKLDEIAVYNRALNPTEATDHFRAATQP